MDVRKDLGGKLEDALCALVDEHMSAEKLLPLIAGVVNGQLQKVKDKIKADVIDLIDGEDDIA